MRAALLLTALLAACQAPAPGVATAVFALDASLGPVSAVRVLATPGGEHRFDAPLGGRVFVPLPAGARVSLAILALDGEVERWRGAQTVGPLAPGAQVAAEVSVEPVGRLEITAPEPDLAVGADGPRHGLSLGPNRLVLRVGTYRLWREGAAVPGVSLTVAHGQITRWDEALCTPAAEVCDGADDDCDGQVDEGVLNACGACGAVPDEACDGADNDCDGQTDEDVLNACGACGAVPDEACNGADDDCDGAADEGVLNACGECGPAPDEICDGVDDDCDGAIDEGVRNACGECAPPLAEACDGVDQDCDGVVDEGVPQCAACDPTQDDCRIYESCRHALRVGALHDGRRRLARDGQVDWVWCDQTTEGGGWTLIGNAPSPLDERLGGRVAGLTTAATTDEDDDGVWAGLRELDGPLELRVACRLGATDDPRAPFEVDLMVTGVDLLATLALGDGGCLDAVAVTRRDLLTGREAAGVVALEPACMSPGELLLSLSGDPDAADETAWGAWGGESRCGLARGRELEGQWLMFAREAPRARVARLHHGQGEPGPMPVQPTDLVAPEALDRFVFDAVWLDGAAADWAQAGPEVLAAVARFVADGGHVMLTHGAAAALGPAGLGWLAVEVTPGDPAGAGLLAETQGGQPDPFWRMLQSPYVVGGDQAARLSRLGALGPAAQVAPIARQADPDGMPLGGPVIARARRCGANLIMVGVDFGPVVDRTLLLLGAALQADLRSPAAAWVQDTCPWPPLQVRRCGRFGAVALPPEAQVDDGCDVAGADVLLLGVEAPVEGVAGLRDWVRAGGRVVGSAGASAAALQAVFGDVAAPGGAQGACGGDLRPPAALNPKHWFWARNGLDERTPPAGGCGRDLAALPGLVPLGGWDADTVSLGYRELGRGRVWFVESDWPEAAALTPDAQGLLWFMIRH